MLKTDDLEVPSFRAPLGARYSSRRLCPLNLEWIQYLKTFAIIKVETCRFHGQTEHSLK